MPGLLMPGLRMPGQGMPGQGMPGLGSSGSPASMSLGSNRLAKTLFLLPSSPRAPPHGVGLRLAGFSSAGSSVITGRLSEASGLALAPGALRAL